jgi:transcriptional regulator with XRE-family HTH domain
MTRRQFCARLGISEAYLSQIVNGRRNPSLRKVAEMSRVLRVDLGRLFAVRAMPGGATPWSGGQGAPEPGDAGGWYPGKVSRPYAALEAHYRLVFYPGPDLAGEKIPARSYLVVDPRPGELGFEAKYALQDEEDRTAVASFAGGGGGKRQRFITPDGRALDAAVGPAFGEEETAAARAPRFLGRIAGVLVEF